MDETTAGSPHELLLRLAGRVDDDLLADARELVAVGEDGHALELLTAALAAEGTALPPAVRAELVAAARDARIDLDVDAALTPAAPDTTAHRFAASTAADVPVLAAVRELPERLRAGVRLRLAWRLTPAGAAPGPLPHPVLLVETPEGGRPGEVTAYQMGAALARSGVAVAVEVLTSGRPLAAYHAAALRDSCPLEGGAGAVAASPPEVVESVVAEVVQEVTAAHRPGNLDAGPDLPPDAGRPGASELFGGSAARTGNGHLTADDEPAPRPVPIRSWQGGRRRRTFGDPAEDGSDDSAGDGVDHADAPTKVVDIPVPGPVPLARRIRPEPPAPVATDPEVVGGEVAGADVDRPDVDRPDRDGADRGGPDVDGADRDGADRDGADVEGAGIARSEADGAPEESGWANEWASGDWALAAPDPVSTSGLGSASGAVSASRAASESRAASASGVAAAGDPASEPSASTTVTGGGVAGDAVAGRAHASAADTAMAGGPATGSTASGATPSEPPPWSDARTSANTADELGFLKPESLSRLSAADRELLARLQAELAAPVRGSAAEEPAAGEFGGAGDLAPDVTPIRRTGGAHRLLTPAGDDPTTDGLRAVVDPVPGPGDRGVAGPRSVGSDAPGPRFSGPRAVGPSPLGPGSGPIRLVGTGATGPADSAGAGASALERAGLGFAPAPAGGPNPYGGVPAGGFPRIEPNGGVPMGGTGQPGVPHAAPPGARGTGAHGVVTGALGGHPHPAGRADACVPPRPLDLDGPTPGTGIPVAGANGHRPSPNAGGLNGGGPTPGPGLPPDIAG